MIYYFSLLKFRKKHVYNNSERLVCFAIFMLFEHIVEALDYIFRVFRTGHVYDFGKISNIKMFGYKIESFLTIFFFTLLLIKNRNYKYFITDFFCLFVPASVYSFVGYWITGVPLYFLLRLLNTPQHLLSVFSALYSSLLFWPFLIIFYEKRKKLTYES